MEFKIISNRPDECFENLFLDIWEGVDWNIPAVVVWGELIPGYNKIQVVEFQD